MKEDMSLKLFAPVFLFVLLFASSTAAAQFQADVIESREVVIRKGHIWFKDRLS